MSAVAALASAPRRIRVAIAIADPSRRAVLLSVLENFGHETVRAAEADVTLCDRDSIPADGSPAIALGGGEGVAGALAADADAAQIDAAIRAVAAGLIVRAADLPAPGFTPLAEEPHPLLTPRELEVLVAIGEGLSNKGIARKLGISPHTVKFHLESLFRKLDAANRAEAVAKGTLWRTIEL